MSRKEDYDAIFKALVNNGAGSGNISAYDIQYYKGLRDNKILCAEEISEETIEKIVLPLEDMIKDDSVENIELILDTPGGSISSGLCLCSIIDKITKPLTIRILGNALSMGVLIAMAGYKNPNVKKVCYPYTEFLIHDVSYGVEGTSHMVDDYVEFSKKILQRVDEYILSHSNIPLGTFKKKKKSEWYLTADEALSYGIVTEIL